MSKQKPIIKTTIKSMCPVALSRVSTLESATGQILLIFAEIIIETSVEEFIISKVLCFKHIFLNGFRLMSLRIILQENLVLDVETTFRKLQKSH